MPMWGYGLNWQMTLWMLFLLLIVFGLAGLLIWAFARRESNPNHHRDAQAISILNERFARGELDTETFDAMRTRLQAPSSLVERDATPL